MTRNYFRTKKKIKIKRKKRDFSQKLNSLWGEKKFFKRKQNQTKTATKKAVLFNFSKKKK